MTKDRGFCLYLTGLPASGKTTLALGLQGALAQAGQPAQLLDSDELRRVLTPEPTYTDEERDWFYDVLGFIAGLLTQSGVNVIVAATAPARRHRLAARQRVERFGEVYVECPSDVCRQRDLKGLWEKADRGEITNLPGVGDPYEVPKTPLAKVNTSLLSPDEALHSVMRQLKEAGFPAKE